GSGGRPGPAPQTAESRPPRPGAGGPEVPGEGPGPALRLRRGAGRRPGTLAARRADPGAARGSARAGAEVGQAAPGGGDPPGGGVRVRGRGVWLRLAPGSAD